MTSVARVALTRRSVLGASAAGGALATTIGLSPEAHAAYPAILKPIPADAVLRLGTNAELRWDSVEPRRYLTDQSRLFVRNPAPRR